MTSEGNRDKAENALTWHAAYHEAGHAVVAVHLHVPIGTVAFVTVDDPRGIAHTEFLARPFRNPWRYASYINHTILAILAGAFAADKFQPEAGWAVDSQGRQFTADCHSDRESALELAMHNFGLSRSEAETHIDEILRPLAQSIVERPEVAETIHRTAAALVASRQLSAREVRVIYREVKSRHKIGRKTP